MFFVFDPATGWVRISEKDFLFHLRDAAKHPIAYEGWIFMKPTGIIFEPKRPFKPL